MKWLKGKLKLFKHPSLSKVCKSCLAWPIWKKYSKWEWTIIVTGILTIFFVFINLFTSLGDKTPLPYVSTKISLSNISQFEEVVAATVNSPVEQSSPLTILTNGDEFLSDLLQEIHNAQHSIYITDYIWDNGVFGNTILLALIEKAKQGVEVRLLLDGVSGSKANKKHIQELSNAGGKVARFRPVTWWNINRLDRRTHIRDFVIDNKISYLGGVAISDAWLGNATSSKQWHDFMYKSSSSMAERSNTIFRNIWSQTTGESLTLATSSKASTRSASSTEYISLLSTPAPDLSSNLEHFIWLSVTAAEKSIHIENPYLLPSPALVQALENKAREGVNVEIIVPGTNTDTQYTRWASQSFYRSLLAAGVKIYEYQPSRIHAKVMTMDSTWSIIGSANLDNRSSKINLELIMGVHDEHFAKDVEAKFEQDKLVSKEIVTQDWSFSSIIMIPLRLISRLFIHQL